MMKGALAACSLFSPSGRRWPVGPDEGAATPGKPQGNRI
jgi:hypothetical protein